MTGPVGLAVLAFKKYKTQIVSVFTGIRDTVTSVFKGIGNTIVNALKGAVNIAIDLLNKPIKAVNKISGKVPGMPDLPEIPRLAKGGIVSKPTLLIAGEAGSEAVVPLPANGRFGSTVVNVVMNIASNDPDAIASALNRSLRFNGVGVAR